MHAQRDAVVVYLKDLRERIIKSFESIESSPLRFQREAWNYGKGHGGGEMSVLRGETFEKAAVNWSGVGGESFPMDDAKGAFFATGVSLITHMKNPKMPTVHFNIRYIETAQGCWLGGGFDLTPMGFEREEDTRHFHAVAERALAPFGETLYPQFKEAAREYFWIKHRNRERGVGGIFFDHFKGESFEQDLAMWKSVGDHFLEAIMPIYQRRLDENFTDEDKKTQLKYRGHYAEFNLAYDRGTKFGFLSGGNTEAILCSMPPVATW